MNRSTRRGRLARAILTLVVALSTSANGQPTPAAPSPKTIPINGTVLHYMERGSGTPIVFVHGGLSDYRAFLPQFEAFATSFRVVTYSRRFYPPNDVPAGLPRSALQDHVDDLVELIKALGLGSAHLIGHSYGGYVALTLALQKPQLVRSLVLGEPPVFSLLESSSVGRGLRQSFEQNALQPAANAFRAGNLENGLRQFIDGIMGAGTANRMAPEALQRVITFGPAMRPEMLTDLSSYLPELACEPLGKLKAPVLLVTGERSVPIFHVVTRELEQCLETETHVILPDADHSVHGRNPAGFLKAVQAFLQR